VSLFERHARPGFVAHAVRVDGVEVDVPLRVFYPGYYPTLVRLYAELGVASEPVSYASSFYAVDRVPFFRYRNLRLGSRSWSYLLPHDLAAGPARRIAAAALRFRREAAAARAAGTLGTRTIGEFAAGYPHEFVEGLLLPAIATICTCPYEAARAFPAALIVDYLLAGVTGQAVRRARGGAAAAADRVAAALGQLHTGVAVAGVRRLPDGAELRFADRPAERFDHVVLATQANQALALLHDASATERAALAAFDYCPIDVLMHRDARVMPAAPRHWSAVNLLVTPGAAQPQSTIWINAVQPALQGAPALFQTVHPIDAVPAPIAHARLERPVVTPASERALDALAALHAEPGRRLWFCGSYAERGVPLLESAVRSAARVVERIAPGAPALLQPARAEISA
jgi:predicted NAD/FAD-binding protein